MTEKCCTCGGPPPEITPARDATTARDRVREWLDYRHRANGCDDRHCLYRAMGGTCTAVELFLVCLDHPIHDPARDYSAELREAAEGAPIVLDRWHAREAMQRLRLRDEAIAALTPLQWRDERQWERDDDV